MKCESCMDCDANIELKDKLGPVTYNICGNCLQELISYSLTPQHFKNLLKNGHSETEFYLHDDFYDEDGNALQPWDNR